MRFKLALLWLRIKQWFDLEECPKERLGYTCHHRVYTNGSKECGN